VRDEDLTRFRRRLRWCLWAAIALNLAIPVLLVATPQTRGPAVIGSFAGNWTAAIICALALVVLRMREEGRFDDDR
jgi:ABC-type glycerol-3-phosphate transport system permease component